MSGKDMQGAASPLRTCLACRGVLPKKELLRLALTEGRPRVDMRSRAGGRGAYICPKKECLFALCKKKGALSRAFKANVPLLDVKELVDEITAILNARSEGGVLDDKKETIN